MVAVQVRIIQSLLLIRLCSVACVRLVLGTSRHEGHRAEGLASRLDMLPGCDFGNGQNNVNYRHLSRSGTKNNHKGFKTFGSKTNRMPYRICRNIRPPRNKRPPKTVIFQRGEYTKPMGLGWVIFQRGEYATPYPCFGTITEMRCLKNREKLVMLHRFFLNFDWSIDWLID